MIKNFALIAVLAALLGAGPAFAADEKPAAAAKKSAAELEKEKALADPYANDLGPSNIDDIVMGTKEKPGYPKEYQEGYKLLKTRCSQCHGPERPLNSQFAETEGKDMKERMGNAEKLKKSHPELFKGDHVWQVEGDIWQRYVKRMMAKPGCNITKEEGKKIWDFLAYDSNARKFKDKDAWTKHRKGLLEEFKKKHPKRYETLYGTGGH